MVPSTADELLRAYAFSMGDVLLEARTAARALRPPHAVIRCDGTRAFH
jgi:hypothetical protein